MRVSTGVSRRTTVSIRGGNPRGRSRRSRTIPNCLLIPSPSLPGTANRRETTRDRGEGSYLRTRRPYVVQATDGAGRTRRRRRRWSGALILIVARATLAAPRANPNGAELGTVATKAARGAPLARARPAEMVAATAADPADVARVVRRNGRVLGRADGQRRRTSLRRLLGKIVRVSRDTLRCRGRGRGRGRGGTSRLLAECAAVAERRGRWRDCEVVALPNRRLSQPVRGLGRCLGRCLCRRLIRRELFSPALGLDGLFMGTLRRQPGGWGSRRTVWAPRIRAVRHGPRRRVPRRRAPDSLATGPRACVHIR